MATKLPAIYAVASLRCVLPYHGDTDRMGVGFEMGDGTVLRIALDGKSTRTLAGAIREYLNTGMDSTIEPPTQSMRCVRVADLLAEEIGERFFLGGGQREGQPAEAVVSEPDTQAAVGPCADGETRGVLDERVAGDEVIGRIERYGRLQPGARECKLVDDGFQVGRVELSFHLDRYGLAWRILRRIFHGRVMGAGATASGAG